MPKTYKLRPKAISDLEEIFTYPQKTWGLYQAENYIRKLGTTFRELAVNYSLGLEYTMVKKGLYAFPVASHVIFYRHSDEGLTVIRVLHQSMDIQGIVNSPKQ